MHLQHFLYLLLISDSLLLFLYLCSSSQEQARQKLFLIKALEYVITFRQLQEASTTQSSVSERAFLTSEVFLVIGRLKRLGNHVSGL